MCVRGGALPAQVTADVRALLSLPRLPAAYRKRLADQRADRSRSRYASCRQSRTGCGADPERQAQEIYRCPSCRVALWSTYGGVQNLRFVRVGTLDDSAALKPDVHVYVRSKLPWITLPEGVPAFEAYYDSRKLWPAESIERRRAIFGEAPVTLK